jgi:hypothetical protein
MVARIRTGKNMLGALNYNENKVREGKAQCIAENVFGARVDQLAFAAKQKRFDDQMRLNRRSKTNVVHISLNFAVGEKLGNEKLTQIAASYMARIGFGDQPYLVYNHFDAAHPHVHILTTSIQSNGKRIPLHNLGRVQSEKAREEVEQLFNLTKASGRKLLNDVFVDMRTVDAAKYGKSETKAAISKIVLAVMRSYKFTSIPELNAVLKQFNVIADRGNEGTRMFEKKGLVYRMLDEKGSKVGVPIKASAINGKPTLSNLEKLFKLNEALRMPRKARIQKAIQDVFNNGARPTVSDFIARLRKENIVPVFRQNESGRVYGLTFIDNQTRVVFNGSDLGKEYSAKSLLERLDGSIPAPQKTAPENLPSTPGRYSPNAQGRSSSFDSSMEFIKELMDPEKVNQAIEPSLVRKRRRKRRKRSL